MADANVILSDVVTIYKNGKEDEAIDYLYDTVTDIFYSEDFETVDKVLRLAIKSEVPAVLLISLLTITLSCKEKLPSRKKFFEHCKKYFEENASDPDVLYGLE